MREILPPIRLQDPGCKLRVTIVLQMLPNPASAPEATPLRKLPHIWILAAVTYSAVIICTILAVWAYRHYWPGADASERKLEAKSASITVGSVWIPVYPGAVHRDMTASTTAGVTVGDLMFSSSDPPQKLIDFYRSRLSKASLNVTFTKTETGGIVQAVGNRARTIATVTVTAAGTGSTVQVHTRAVENKS